MAEDEEVKFVDHVRKNGIDYEIHDPRVDNGGGSTSNGIEGKVNQYIDIIISERDHYGYYTGVVNETNLDYEKIAETLHNNNVVLVRVSINNTVTGDYISKIMLLTSCYVDEESYSLALYDLNDTNESCCNIDFDKEGNIYYYYEHFNNSSSSGESSNLRVYDIILPDADISAHIQDLVPLEIEGTYQKGVRGGFYLGEFGCQLTPTGEEDGIIPSFEEYIKFYYADVVRIISWSDQHNPAQVLWILERNSLSERLSDEEYEEIMMGVENYGASFDYILGNEPMFIQTVPDGAGNIVSVSISTRIDAEYDVWEASLSGVSTTANNLGTMGRTDFLSRYGGASYVKNQPDFAFNYIISSPSLLKFSYEGFLDKSFALTVYYFESEQDGTVNDKPIWKSVKKQAVVKWKYLQVEVGSYSSKEYAPIIYKEDGTTQLTDSNYKGHLIVECYHCGNGSMYADEDPFNQEEEAGE